MSKVFTITEGLENMGALRTGGQGSVYKGRRIGPIISAVKILPTPVHEESMDDKNYRAFQNEVDKLKKVNEIPNPNVVKILNYGITESGSFPFIEMEYIEGPDLGELLSPPNEKIFTLKEAIKVADQLSCALAHCHKVGVKHGDIKSNNVKFNIQTGNYMLLDFGLSIMSDEQRRSSMRHAGAIEFMAPEQNEGRMLFQTDVYSFGVILYELLAGQVPFPLADNGETARNTVMVSHMEAPVPDLLELRRQNIPASWTEKQQRTEMAVPNWLLMLIDRCLKKTPEARYADGIALHEAVADNRIADVVEEVRKADVPAYTEEPAYTEDQSTQVGSGMMLVSKPVFIGLVILLLGFMGYTTYTLYTERKGPQPVVAAQPVDSITAPVDSDAIKREGVRAYIGRKRYQDSLVKASIQADQNGNGGDQDSAVVDTTQSPQETN